MLSEEVILPSTSKISQIKYKTTILNIYTSLCDYSDVYILMNGITAITGKVNNDAAKMPRRMT